MNTGRFALAMIGALLLSACGSSNMLVLEPIRGAPRTDVVELVYDQSTVGVPDEAVAQTKAYMEEAFFTGEDAAFKHGPGGVTIRYGYVGFKKGSRMGRYFLGPLVNSNAKMVLRAEFFDVTGKKIGEVQSEGEIGGGFFGGSANSAIKRAVKEVAGYAAAQLR